MFRAGFPEDDPAVAPRELSNRLFDFLPALVLHSWL